jgi:hypothetical protein
MLARSSMGYDLVWALMFFSVLNNSGSLMPIRLR